MNDIRFDTLKAARDLKAAGLEEAHAEAIVATMGRAMGENLATKTDIKELEQATRADIKALEQAIKAHELATRADFKSLEQAITNLERATKTDTETPGQTIKAALKTYEQAYSANLKAMERRLTLRLGGLNVAGVAFLATLIITC